jgi:hypothetical protein
MKHLDPDLVEEMEEIGPPSLEEEPELPVDELSREFVDDLIDKILQFLQVLCGHGLHSYQEPLARRIIDSVLIGDGEEVVAEASRQSGKTETVADVVASLLVILPILARRHPVLLGKFQHGFWVGMFAPVEGQVETMFTRAVTRLTSDRAREILEDPEIDDGTKRAGTSVKTLKLIRSGSFVSMMTANPRAKIESKTFHLIIIDEAQDTDDTVVNKSITPMLAYYSGTLVKTGTPTTTKNNFYRSIQYHRRRQTMKRGAKRNYFRWDWRDVAKVNKDYERYVRTTMLQIGEDSDEFNMSYNVRWILERGMFTTQKTMDELSDSSMNYVKSWTKTPVVVGIDPARAVDSTAVMVCWVDWDRPDEYGFYDHRVLNWLEMQGDDWEEQYARIVDFLSSYNVASVAVDGTGLGDVVAQRLDILLPRARVTPLSSNLQEQSKRWKHLMALMERRMVGWPGHPNAKRTKQWQRFQQQMLDAEKQYKAGHLLVAAPNEKWAHDDLVDALALATYLTADAALPTVEVSRSPFWD